MYIHGGNLISGKVTSSMLALNLKSNHFSNIKYTPEL